MTFSHLGLSQELLKAISEQGYTQPTPIQKQAIPAILQGKDVFASAQTGTGKTAGFTLPLLQLLNNTSANKGDRAPRALILLPTRELAQQVGDSVRTYGKYLSLRSAVIYGGVAIRPQTQTLRQGVDIVVATPGRLLDHLEQKNLNLSQIEILVLDECDRMLDMGFIHDIRKILAKLPSSSRQTLMFSATFSTTIRQLANTLLSSPTLIEVAARNTASEQVEQVVHLVDRDRKRELLSYTISFHNWKQVLVFTRTKHGASRLAEQLAKDGLQTAAIHGNKSQSARMKALNDFKQGKVRVLVATDVASRGLDIERLPYVVNYELPNVPEDYVHRIGRTGRAGKEGRAVSLVCKEEYEYLESIEKLLNQTLVKEVVSGYEPSSLPVNSDIKRSPPKRSQQRRSNWAKSATPAKTPPQQAKKSRPKTTPHRLSTLG
ncbi:DEAD/DEAH box helicase [Synechocystis sp. PCC 7509]|uniref:DEAD/DEAH box helicase n=1 Tax=Synechocystis sp. PCC 7509 TaxID=927677 RepID=UPI0002AC02DB|nr:DEAD/DEAH box helicase [Synechocystis sp. PCC 7509]